MAEYAISMINRDADESLVNLATQVQMTSLQSAVNNAIANGVQYNMLKNFGGWELIFGAPRNAGDLPVIYHALQK